MQSCCCGVTVSGVSQLRRGAEGRNKVPFVVKQQKKKVRQVNALKNLLPLVRVFICSEATKFRLQNMNELCFFYSQAEQHIFMGLHALPSKTLSGPNQRDMTALHSSSAKKGIREKKKSTTFGLGQHLYFVVPGCGEVTPPPCSNGWQCWDEEGWEVHVFTDSEIFRRLWDD